MVKFLMQVSLPMRFFIIVFAVGMIAGCASTNSTNGNEKGTEIYTQQVYSISFFDDSGNPIAHPFLGGFNAPRPQFVDIDGDKDPDLFVQEHTDNLMFFEYGMATEASPLKWKTNKFQNLDIGEWFRFVDMDGDGDFDLLTEQPYSYIRYYRNEGSATQPKFTLAADSLKDINGTPIFSDRQNIPNVTDIDCDEKLDLFIGRLDGTLTRYESIGRDENEIPRFKLVNKRFEDIEIVKQFGTLHGANTMAFMDIDQDGDQDIFWGDFFEPGILFLENEGTCSNPQFQGEPRSFPPSNPASTSGYNAPTLADWGQDGDVDLFLGVLGGAYNANETTAENFYFYEQESGRFSLQSEQFLGMIDVGDESIPATGDIDGDGDFDLLVANKIDPANRNTSIVYQFENRGNNTSPEFHMTGTLELPDAYHYAPALVDLNKDGLPDLLISNWKGEIAYYLNTGNGFELKDEAIAKLERGSNAVPEFADIDADGDLDLISGESGGNVLLFRNTGTDESPEFIFEEGAFEGVTAQHRSAPALYDIDSDGDFDLFLGTKIEGYLFFRNKGTASQPDFEQEDFPFETENIQFGSPHFVDLDGDGIAEFISGTRGGGLLFYSK